MDNHSTPDLRDGAALSRLGGPFERSTHLLEVRQIEHGDGRYNIPNVGVHLWRLSAFELRGCVPHAVEDGTGLHFTFSPLGNDMTLFERPEAIASPFTSATERNVPDPIRRRDLHEHLEHFYGENASVAVWNGEALIAREEVAACDLTDWLHPVPTGKTISIDPELGRIAFHGEPASGLVRVLYHYGFSASLGSGSYDRREEFDSSAVRFLHVGTDQNADGSQTIEAALAAWSGLSEAERREHPSVIQIDDSGTYRETLPPINIPEGSSLIVRAAAGQRPALLLESELAISGREGSEFELNGLLVANQAMLVTGELERLRIRHCTFVPGRGLSETGQPLEPGQASLTLEAAATAVDIERSIIGALRTVADCRVSFRDSIVDANGFSNMALQGLEDGMMGGLVQFERVTIIGGVRATEIRLASESLFLGVVEVAKCQQGCMRFSHVPLGSTVPRRFHCQPGAPGGMSEGELRRLARAVRPRFTSLRYGDPGYCQLTPDAPVEIRRGAEDESEMGAFSSLKQSPREESLRIRLKEYLRLGMEAGILYST